MKPISPKLIEDRCVKDERTGCWLWSGAKFNTGYGKIARVIDGKKKYLKAHRLMASYTIGDVTDKFVCHTCDTPSCCNPEHLFIGTCDDNVQDMIRKGRMYVRNKGHASVNSKLTPEQVEHIRSSTTPQYILAAEYGVGQTTVGRVRRHEVYK